MTAPPKTSCLTIGLRHTDSKNDAKRFFGFCFPQNRKYITYHNDVSGGPSHGHSCTMRKNFGKVRSCGFPFLKL